MTIALIDGDAVAYRCAASCEPTKEKLEREPLEVAIQRADELCYRILSDTQAEKYRFFLTGSENFRKKLYPDYKANRANKPVPQYLQDVRAFLVGEWNAEICVGYEADDGIGISANEDSIICAYDKDFRQLVGHHYNFVKSEFFSVDLHSASLAFWSSMLIGDSSDNVRGVDGIGPVKAKRHLQYLSPEDMEHCVYGLYDDPERFSLNYRLLRLIQSEDELQKVLDEATIKESQREKSTEVCSTDDFSPFSTVNS